MVEKFDKYLIKNFKPHQPLTALFQAPRLPTASTLPTGPLGWALFPYSIPPATYGVYLCTIHVYLIYKYCAYLSDVNIPP